MVDRWLGADGTTTRTGFVVSGANPLVHNGRFSIAGLIENLAQTAAAGAGAESLETFGTDRPPRVGVIVSIDRLEVHLLPEIGAELLTETTVTNRVGDIVVISGKITCRQTTVATGVLKILAEV